MSATVHPHPALTAAQCELLCRREGLALAHLGRGRLVLVQTSAPRETLLRIAALDGRVLARKILDALRRPDPEAA